MRSIRTGLTGIAAALLLLTGGQMVWAQSTYSAEELLSPCQEADNDSRWGAAAEAECEQYILGFVGALQLTGAAGPGTSVCLPEVNVADEVRWAFMRWVHGSYSQRKDMPASTGLMATLEESFACPG